MASDLNQQLSQLDELLGLLDANALRTAQEALEHQIAELSERLEVTRQALTQAQNQRRRLARARLLLEDSTPERSTNGDPALKPVADSEPPAAEPPAAAAVTSPFVAERRVSADRRTVGERRNSERRKGQSLPPAS